MVGRSITIISDVEVRQGRERILYMRIETISIIIVLLVIACGAESVFASARTYVYCSPIECRDELTGRLFGIEDKIYCDLENVLDGSNVKIVSDVDDLSILFHGGNTRCESMWFTSESDSELDLAVVGKIESSAEKSLNRKYRVLLRILGSPNDGIVYNCNSPFVDESELDDVVRSYVGKVAERLIHFKKRNTPDISIGEEKESWFSGNLKPTQLYSSIESSLPVGKFSCLTNYGVGLKIGGVYDYTKLSSRYNPSLIICPALSIMNYQSTRSNIEYLRFYSFTIGCALRFEYGRYSVTPCIGTGYLYGVMKYSGGGEKTKRDTYNEPVVFLSAGMGIKIFRVVMTLEPSWNMFIDGGNIGQSIGISVGSRYSL
jgi:hypothetical protein